MSDAPAEIPASPAPSAASPPIAGIGASAGGLAAVMRLMQSLGGEPGLALVLVTHLDPDHESSLVDILAKITPMAVQTARDGELLVANRLYVMPPKVELLIAQGKLRVAARTEGPGPHMPIDRFFQSLAEDQRARAIGVVLSGTGSDGTRGVQAIKAEGGITLAQDESAEHQDMPRSAIATAGVDFVRSPEGIAKELVSLGARFGQPSPDEHGAGDDAPLRRILLAVRRATGIDFSQYKRTTLLRRLQRRAFVHHLSSLREYADLVARDAAEAKVLSEEVLIHVTSFFRDPATFEALKAHVFPPLLEARRGDPPLRVWVPGCSTGEEVYSIAIALLEFLGDAGAADVSIRIFGTDISARAIERARSGTYPESIAGELSAGRLKRFFVRTEGGYQIAKPVRDQCIFATQDITRDPPFSNLDLVSCRNLMIYLDRAPQQRAIPLFHYGLRDPGFLVLGSAESVGAFPGFTLVEGGSRIFRRIPYTGRTPLDFGSAGLPPPPADARAPERASNFGEVRSSADSAILSAMAPVGVIVNEELVILEFRGQVWPYLAPPPGAASLELLRMAREGLRFELRRALDEARATGKMVLHPGVELGAPDATRLVDLQVIPFSGAPAQRFFAVLFHERPSVEPPGDASGAPGASAEAELRRELTATREYLQSVIENVEASNEELRALSEETTSSNEELHSTNEELQTAKEELQATNEELRTTNDEMVERNATTERLASDLANVLESAALPIVILGRDSCIRRFTPAAAHLLSLIPADVGRPLADLKPKLQTAVLPELIAEVLDRLAPVERTVRGDDGRWYRLSVRPYLTTDHRVDGTVISALDIDGLKSAERQLQQARDYAEGIVETVREGLVILDENLRVHSANRAFYETFKLSRGEAEKKLFLELDGGAWDLPELRELLAKERPGELVLEHDFPRAGRRVVRVCGRRILRTRWLLLALDDDTERTRAEEALQKSETGFRRMLASAADGIVMVDEAEHVVFANAAIAKMLGYRTDQLLAMRFGELVPHGLRDAHALREGAAAAREGLVLPEGAPRSNPPPYGRDGNLAALHRDGREIPIEMVLSPMDSNDGRVTVAFITDITARRESARKIQEYQEKLQRMAFEATVMEQHERKRIANDLHDRIGQALAVAQVKMTAAREQTQGETHEAIQQALDLVAETIADARTLIFELSPPILYDLGLRAALSWLAEEVEKRYGLRVEVTDDGTQAPLDDTTAAILLRSVRELLMNVVKHAGVGRASVALRTRGDSFEIEVSDAGEGFDLNAPARPAGNDFGLFSVREQLSLLGGAVEVVSSPRGGTRVTLRVRIAPAAKTPRENER